MHSRTITLLTSRENNHIQNKNSTKKNAEQVLQTLATSEVELLTAENEVEVLAFLSQRPIHTVAMKSFIHDNGLVSPLNRGSFYGCRDINGHLEGVALVGHATLMETVSDRACKLSLTVARECSFTHMIMGEQERIAEFWTSYSQLVITRLACRERLMELSKARADRRSLSLDFELATEEDYVR